MDRLAVLQEAIDRTLSVGEHYLDCGNPMLEIRAEDLHILPGENHHSWLTGALQRAVVLIADAHAGCDTAGCRTCDEIADGLGGALFGLRMMQEEEMEERVR